jgi:hypothetical protein
MESRKKVQVAVCAWGKPLISMSSNISLLLEKEFFAQGLEILDCGDPRATHFVSIQHNPSCFRRNARKMPLQKRILVTFEPRAASPSEYSRKVTKRYGHIIRNSRNQRVNSEEDYFGVGAFWQPQVQKLLSEHAEKPRDSLTVAMLNSNRYSFVKGSKYALRQDVITNLARNRDDLTVLLGGPDWDQGLLADLREQLKAVLYAFYWRAPLDLRLGRLPIDLIDGVVYKGPIEDGQSFLSQAKFAVVIENEPTYVSEKLFNAIFAGCIPLYYGPDLSSMGVPKEIAIQIPNGEPEEFLKVFNDTSDSDTREVLAAGRAWVQTKEAAELFGTEASTLRLAHKLYKLCTLEESVN